MGRVRLMLLILLFPVVVFSRHVTADSSFSVAEPKIWFAKDKGQHLLGSFMLAGALTLSFKRFGDISRQEAFTKGVTITFSVGLGKEVFDASRKNNHFSWPDLVADVAGIALAYAVFR